MDRYCPLCNRSTRTHEEIIPPCVVLTCSACGHVHAIRSLPEVHATEGANPTPVVPHGADLEHVPDPTVAHTCTPSAAENRAPDSRNEPTPGDEVHRP